MGRGFLAAWVGPAGVSSGVSWICGLVREPARPYADTVKENPRKH